jgi:hypothetical protein
MAGEMKAGPFTVQELGEFLMEQSAGSKVIISYEDSYKGTMLAEIELVEVSNTHVILSARESE